MQPSELGLILEQGLAKRHHLGPSISGVDPRIPRGPPPLSPSTPESTESAALPSPPFDPVIRVFGGSISTLAKEIRYPPTSDLD